MSYTNNLMDLNLYANDLIDLDAESPDNYLNVHDFSNTNWPDKQGNFDTSPILDGNVWVGFNADQGGVTKLVSSEEDLICSSPEHEKKNCTKNGKFDQIYVSEDWEKEFTINCNNHGINQDMDHLADGFASNEVITIGEYGYDEDNQSSPESHNKTMADRWSSNDYNTVLRINNANEKKFSTKSESERPESQNLSNKNRESLTNLDDNICADCNERVYITEKLVIHNDLYHRQCFKCYKCRRILSINNFATTSGRLFCKPHFLEMFHQTGKYDEMDLTKCSESNRDSYMEKENKTENTLTDELPPPQITKNIVEKFRLLESAVGTESLLPRQCSGKQATRNYQSTNILTDNKSNADCDKNEDLVDELPTPGMTRNLLSLWNNIESKSMNSSNKSTSPTCGTPKKSNKVISQTSYPSLQSVDVVRHDDSLEDNYPAPNTTKSLAAKFQGDPPKPPTQNQSNTVANRNSNYNRNILLQSNIRGDSEIVSNATPNEDWLQSRVFDPNQGSENNPIQRPDVITSESKNELDELPEQGITQNLVGLFRSLEVKR